MTRGLPKTYIVKARRELPKGASISSIFKRAWKLYKKSKVYKPITKKLRSQKVTKTKKKTKKVRKMPKKRKRGNRKFSLPLGVVLGASAGFVVPPAGGTKSPLQLFMEGNWNRGLHELTYNYTGFHGDTGKWMPQNARGILALLGGFAVHWVASKIGVNRALGRARVPIIRI